MLWSGTPMVRSGQNKHPRALPMWCAITIGYAVLTNVRNASKAVMAGKGRKRTLPPLT